MSGDISVDTIVEGIPPPYLPNRTGKPNYTVIKETHQILKSNVAMIESDLGEVQNSYLRLVILPEQYARISIAPFV